MNLDDRYLIWQLVAVKYAYVVSRFDDAFLRRPPGSLKGIWPEGAFCVLDTNEGSGDFLLPDSLWNRNGRLFVSPRLKTFLAKSALPDVEYWPIKVIDSSGRPLSEPYFFVHFLNAPDCLDLDASGAKRSRILPGIAEKVELLAFKSDPAKPLFRPRTFGQVTLIAWELAAALSNAGFSGFRFMGLFDYGIKGDLPPNPKRQAVDALSARLWKNARS